MTSRQLVPLIVIPFIAWRVYMRARRNIGRQPFRPTRLKVSIGLFSLITLGFGLGALTHPPVLAALGGGLVLSVGLAWWGLHLTKFEDTPQGKFYTPNTALGIAVTALFIGRLLYRILVVSVAPALQTAAAPLPFQSPLTFFLFGLSAGYYIAYQTGVLLRARQPGISHPEE
jgi:hypothetical protein